MGHEVLNDIYTILIIQEAIFLSILIIPSIDVEYSGVLMTNVKVFEWMT